MNKPSYKRILNWLLILPAFLLFACCERDEGPPPPTPNPEPGYTQYGAPYADVPATADIVMYEVNMRSMSQEGDFQGVVNRLDSIKALGVNVVWLMPIYPVGEINSVGALGSPYAVQDYLKVNPEFGNLENLRDLVEKAHDRNMAVILDWVGNHTAWDNPWITNKSWYTQDENGNIISPAGTGWNDVADLNYDNYEMRAAMIDAMKYWVLEANVDGYRCDAADFVPADFWTSAISELNVIPDRKLILLAEGGEPANFQSGFEMNYAWDFNSQLKAIFSENVAAATIFPVNSAELADVSNDGKKLRYTTNHDLYASDGTPSANFGSDAGSVAAFAIACYLDGVPLIYTGQEIAWPEEITFFDRVPLDWSLNPGITAQYKKIVGARKALDPIRYGSTVAFPADDVVAFKKEWNGEEVLVLVNVRGTTTTYTPSADLLGTSWVNYWNDEAVDFQSSIMLAPYEYLVLTH